MIEFGLPFKMNIMTIAFMIDAVMMLVFLFFWYFFVHVKGNIYILKKNKGMYIQVEHRRISRNTQKVQVKYKGESKTFMIEPSFFDGNKPNAFVDWDKGHIITFKDVKVNLSPNEQDIFLGGRILPQLIRGLLQEHLNLILLILSAIAFFVLGLFISPYLPLPTHTTNTPTTTEG